MALSAQQVIKTYDYYNSLTLVPGYVATGYEQEQYIAKAQYSTDFSSNPIGSKVDFFTHLNDPCISIVAPHPVFTIPKPLSALDPQWFNGYWDEAMFYSHPLVKEQISANAPDVYQDFSDSVGTLTYTPNDFDPGNPGAYGHDAFNSGLLGKIPSRLSNQVNKLNGDMFKLYEKFSPAGLGLDKNTFVSQVFAHQSSTYTLQAGIATRFGSLKIKLPFNTNMTGNLIDPVAWTQKNVIEGVNTAVDKINGVIKTPGRLLSEGLTKLKSLLPKITLPSLSKLLGLNVPDSNISNVLASLQTYGNAVKSILSTAQGVITAAQQTQQAIQQGCLLYTSPSPRD